MSLLVLWGQSECPPKGPTWYAGYFKLKTSATNSRRGFFFLPSCLPKEILIEKLASWREPQHIHLRTYEMRAADREDSSIHLFARFPSVSVWSCQNLFTKCLHLPIYWWIAYLPLLGPKWHIYLSFCLILCNFHAYMNFPHTRIKIWFFPSNSPYIFWIMRPAELNG